MSAFLNCRSIEAARATVAELVGMSEPELRRRLREIEVPAYQEPCEHIARVLLDVDINGAPAPSYVHWFHASRVVDPESFRREGILTKAAARSKLRPLVEELCQGIPAEGMYANNGSVMAKMAFNDEGPFGFLLRSAAIQPRTHFFRAPESVEDMAGSFVRGNVLRVVERYQACTSPCLVEFKGPGAPRHVAYALWYVHLVETGCSEIDAATAANTCFDGHGVAIPASDVIDVEHLPPETGRLRRW